MDETTLPVDADGCTLACCACQRLLDDPRQLQCLHNCCRQCVDDITDKEGSRRVTCPECKQVSSIDATRRNYLIAARVSRFKFAIEAKTCGVCKEDGVASKPSLVWCTSCRRSLCAECTPGHAKYNRNHETMLLDEVTSWNDACPLPEILCPQHEKAFDLVCLTSEAIQCVDCWMSCNKGRHEVQHVADASVGDRVTKNLDEVRRSRKDLQSKLSQLSGTFSLQAEVKRAKDAALAGLKQRKQQVMVAVDDAYVAAVESITESFDALHDKVAKLNSAATSLDKKVGYAVSYSDTVVKTGEARAVIDQSRHIMDQFSLLCAELDAMKHQSEVTDMPVVISSLPGNLADVVQGWIGSLRLPAGKSCKDLGQREVSSTTAACSVRDASVAAPAVIGPQSAVCAKDVKLQDAQQRLNTDGCTHKMSSECWDLAVTPEGHLLLAALGRGLMEFDCSGRQLNVWKPQEEISGHKWITRVDCLSDGRAVVAASYKDIEKAAESTIILLQRIHSSGGSKSDDRGSSDWTEKRRFVGLSSPAHQLSASEDLLAFSHSERGRLSWVPGRCVTLISLSRGNTLWARQFEYRVQSVAVVGLLVITASSDRLTLLDGRSRYVVDGHSRSGDLVWRRALTDQVNDMCAAEPRTLSPERLELCLAQRDGLWTIDVSCNVGAAGSPDAPRENVAWGTENLARLSIGRRHPATVATLSEDWRTYTVVHREGGSNE